MRDDDRYDDDYEDRPRRRSSGGGGGTVLLILGIVGGVILLIGGGLALLLIPAVAKVRDAASRVQSMNNMKQMALGFDNQMSQQGYIVPAIMSKDGKPLLSWRVALLPYVEQDNLYRQFKLNEPWDSAHNKALLKHLPAVYRATPGQPKEPFATHYQVFVGEGAGFEGKEGLRITDFTDGTS